jgi:hypothetical protein
MLLKLLKYFLIFFVFVDFGCSTPINNQLIGEWRLDSAYYFYNNFGYSSDGWPHEEIYEFTPDGVAFTKAFNSSISSQYVVNGKELIYLDEQGNSEDTYEILELSNNSLVMKTVKDPVFKGVNQSRYEIRYLTKVAASNSIEKK